MSKTHIPLTSDALAVALDAHRRGDLAAAEEGYREILDREPDNADALHLFGLVRLAAGDLDEAENSIIGAIRSAPKKAVYYFNLGNVQRRAGNARAAIESFRRSLELSPDDADAWNNLAQALVAAGDTAGALDCLEKAHALQPGDAQIACNLGALLFGLDRFDAAAQCFQAALRSDPTLAEAHNNLGAVLQSLGDNTGAAESYARALEHAPEFAQAHKNLAAALHLLGRRDEAVAHYREALRLDPDYEEAAYELAALEGDARAAPPSAYVAGVFDQYAHEYDAHMTGVLGYTVPQQLRAALQPRLPEQPLDILDLGCGTGLGGAVLKDRARWLVGVDLAPKMIAKARERGIYDELVAGDVVAAIHAMTRRFDLIVAADVFVYLGDLESVFAGARRLLRDDGLFAFSVERGAGDAFILRDAGRYAHGPDYIRALAAQHRFGIVTEQPTVLRKDFGRDIDGTLYVLAPTA
jgi:predicted TPR repeat methyltransferase